MACLVSWGSPKSLGLSFFRIKVVQFWDMYGHFTVFYYYYFSGKSIQDLGAGYCVHGGEQPLSDLSHFGVCGSVDTPVLRST